MPLSEIEFFDRLAPRWDADEVRSTPPRVRAILSRITIRSGMNVLDLGTGTGVLLPYFSEMVGPGGHITAVDFSEGMLAVAKDKFGSLPNVEFLRLDFEKDHIPGHYDLVMLYCVYPHLHSPAHTLRRLFKMNVKSGGVIVIAFPSSEKFINSIHRDRKAASDILPSAPMLAAMLHGWGFQANVVASSEDEYIIEVRLPKE